MPVFVVLQTNTIDNIEMAIAANVFMDKGD